MRKQIKNIMERAEHEHYGLRVTEEALEVGQIPADSRIWIDDEPTDETLNGASVIKINDIDSALKMIAMYFGDHVALIGYDFAEWGLDDGEHIARNGRVLATFTR